MSELTSDNQPTQSFDEKLENILSNVYRAGYNKAEHDEKPQNVAIETGEYFTDPDDAKLVIKAAIRDARPKHRGANPPNGYKRPASSTGTD